MITYNLEWLKHKISQSLTFSEETFQLIEENRAFLEKKILEKSPIYGVNTGFGPLVNETISDEDQLLHQYNLLQQLSCNDGKVLPKEISRLIFLIRLLAFSKARSGISTELFEHLIHLYNHQIYPVFRSYGSVGASGDLVPLASFARFVVGKDDCYTSDSDEIKSTDEVFQQFGIKPYALKTKEGLALVNGTSFSTGITLQSYFKLKQWLENGVYPLISLIFLIFNDSLQHLSEQVYSVKSHESAKEVALKLRKWLDCEYPQETFGVPQPPYSSRSSVLWLGAALERMNHAKEILTIEFNSVDDNPLIFHESEHILHAANFQGTYTAIAADELAAAISQIAILLDRTANRLTHPALNGDLPAFLADEPVGLNSGLQGLQLLITSLTADLKTRTNYHSLSSIPTNADNQDIVSMSANASLATFENLDRFQTLIKAFKIIVLRAASLKQLNPGAYALNQWYQAEQVKIQSIQFNDPNLNYRKLMEKM